MTDEAELVVIFSGGLVEADLVKGLLDQAGIEAFLYNEQSTFIAVAGALVPHQVAVARRDLAEAVALVQALSEDIGAGPS
ncbi:MAG: DUF2007 domain-containing protein [Candidatus Latescibacteria bacterium]|nr:DUF2007 domain-containing protein [Candidatus Latescibacterota bacterium]